jgi:hypothetical protein
VPPFGCTCTCMLLCVRKWGKLYFDQYRCFMNKYSLGTHTSLRVHMHEYLSSPSMPVLVHARTLIKYYGVGKADFEIPSANIQTDAIFLKSYVTDFETLISRMRVSTEVNKLPRVSTSQEKNDNVLISSNPFIKTHYKSYLHNNII